MRHPGFLVLSPFNTPNPIPNNTSAPVFIALCQLVLLNVTCVLGDPPIPSSFTPPPTFGVQATFAYFDPSQNYTYSWLEAVNQVISDLNLQATSSCQSFSQETPCQVNAIPLATTLQYYTPEPQGQTVALAVSGPLMAGDIDEIAMQLHNNLTAAVQFAATAGFPCLSDVAVQSGFEFFNVLSQSISPPSCWRSQPLGCFADRFAPHRALPYNTM